MSMYFQGANIHGGEFRAYNQTIQNVGIQALSQAISQGAMRDSADRDPPPRCHPGTRERATEDIVQWIEDPDSSSTVLWVSGRAGVGKSALMQRIAELDGIYFGGCFFFRRGAPGRNVKDHLFSTLAYQLARNVHGMLEHVDRAMMQDFSLPGMSAAVQLKRLIIDPIRLLPIPAHPTIIIIDGLDECEDFNSQRDILTLIGQVTMDPDIAIRFIIASRPEHQICDMFNKEPLFSRTRRLVLDEGYDTAADIERYFREKFEEIYLLNRDIMPDVRSSWPTANDLRELVWRASGQFIYAATVIKFVDSDTDFHTPAERLTFILTPGPMQALAFSELDLLYTQILSLYRDTEVLVHVLGVVLVFEATSAMPSPANSPAMIAAIPGFGEAKLHRVLRALQAVTEIRNDSVFDDADDNEPNGTNIQRVKLSHRSFHDFLTDRARSGPYFIDKALFGGRVFCRILELATISINDLKRCRSLLPPINPDIWYRFQLVFPGVFSLKPSSKMELCLALNNLRAVLFNDQLVLSGQVSKPFCAALIPILHCVCSGLHIIRQDMLFDLPKRDDPLQLDQFFANVQNLLDEFYQQTAAGSVVGPSSTLIHLALKMGKSSSAMSKSLKEIGDTCNVTDRQLLRTSVEEHSYLIHTQYKEVEGRCVLAYAVPHWLHEFLFHPNRSQSFYLTSRIIEECQGAIKGSILDPNRQYHYMGLIFFFMPMRQCSEIAHASYLLESVGNGSDSSLLLSLLCFLRFLSEIDWFDVYNRGWAQKSLANSIMHWVCTTLESSSLEPGPIRDAMQKIFTAILPRGILPALGQHISRASKLSIFENQSCLCCQQDIPALLNTKDFEVLPLMALLKILPMCTGQNLFQTFCTGVIESILLGTVAQIISRAAIDLRHTCRDGFIHSEDSKVDPFEISDKLNIHTYPNRHHWSFAFAHASTSSKCILFAIRNLFQLNPFFKYPWTTEWIVIETINWLKNQTADPHPQDQLIAWMEDANKKIEEAMANWRQRDIDEELQRSVQWARVIQTSQTM